jgi:hypothetical protein
MLAAFPSLTCPRTGRPAATLLRALLLLRR